MELLRSHPLAKCAAAGLPVLALVLLLGAASPAPAPLALRILSQTTLGAEPSPATNVRLAGSDAVYLSRFKHGVALVSLGATPKVERQLTPLATDTGMVGYDRLAVSPRFLVASAKYNTLGYRSLANGQPSRHYIFQRVTVGLIEAMDLQDDRLLVLGDPERSGPVSPSGAVAWMGTLSPDYVKNAKPILIGAAGPGAHHLDSCSAMGLGAVRFLADGSYLIVPGIEPGAYLYNPAGTLTHRYTSEEIGIDTDCRTVTDAQTEAFRRQPGERFRYLNAHRVVDDILPLAAGPGIIVRSIAAGQTHWSLTILGPNAVQHLDLPFTGALDERLRGDAAGSRVVLLQAPLDLLAGKTSGPSQLIVAELASAPTAGGRP